MAIFNTTTYSVYGIRPVDGGQLVQGEEVRIIQHGSSTEVQLDGFCLFSSITELKVEEGELTFKVPNMGYLEFRALLQ